MIKHNNKEGDKQISHYMRTFFPCVRQTQTHHRHRCLLLCVGRMNYMKDQRYFLPVNSQELVSKKMLKALDDKALNADCVSTLTYTLVTARKRRRSTHPCISTAVSLHYFTHLSPRSVCAMASLVTALLSWM